VPDVGHLSEIALEPVLDLAGVAERD